PARPGSRRWRAVSRGAPAASPMLRTGRSIVLGVAYLLSVIIGTPAIGPAFAPDSPGYIEFSPYRQPLYGMWASGSFSVLGTWGKVQEAQIAIFALSGA